MIWRGAWIACVGLAALALPEPTAALRTLPAQTAFAEENKRKHAFADTYAVPDLRMWSKPYFKTSRMCMSMQPAEGVPTCVMKKQEGCALSSLRKNGSTMIYPGGETRCLNGRRPAFAFQIFPGRRDQLHIVFDAGGAEWDPFSTSLESANKTEVWPQREEGFLRRDAADNPFRNYTIVFVQYCSGDLHSGNAVQSWRDVRNEPVIQRGYQNTMSAVNWALANMEPVLKSLVVSGASAGGIAAEIWASKLLRTFKYESARIWVDSYVPVFPPNFQGKIFKRLGVCGNNLLKDNLKEQCEQGTLSIEQVFYDAIKAHPQVGFGSVTNAVDAVQTNFYKLAAATDGRLMDFTFFNPETFELKACQMFSKYHENPNFVSFMIDAHVHILTLCDDVFSLAAKIIEPTPTHAPPLWTWKSMFLKSKPTSTQVLPLWKWMSMFLKPNSTVRSVLDTRERFKGSGACGSMLGTKALHMKA